MKNVVIACMLLLPFGLFAQILEEGVTIQPLVIKDQFEKNMLIEAETKQILIAFTKEQGEIIKTVLEANPNYLRDNKALYLMDASSVPGLVMSMFMLPKFKKYSYAVGLLEKEQDVAYFPKKENSLTIVSLNNFTVASIEFKEKL